jgi:hypothetical protein
VCGGGGDDGGVLYEGCFVMGTARTGKPKEQRRGEGAKMARMAEVDG